VRVTDRTKLSEATGRALFNPVQFVSALFNGRVADGFLNRRSQVRSLPGAPCFDEVASVAVGDAISWHRDDGLALFVTALGWR
jgi:hypothetical protein